MSSDGPTSLLHSRMAWWIFFIIFIKAPNSVLSFVAQQVINLFTDYITPHYDSRTAAFHVKVYWNHILIVKTMSNNKCQNTVNIIS